MIRSNKHVATGVVDLNGRLGIKSSRQTLEANRWTAAAVEMRDKIVGTGSDGVDSAKRL